MRRLRSGTAVFRTRLDGRIVEWNPEAERLTGIGAAEAEGRPCWDVIAGRHADGGVVCHTGCSTARLAREGWPVRCLDVYLQTRRGAKRVTLSTIVLRSEDGPVTLHTMHESVGAPAPASPSECDSVLTPRQREILLLLAHGVRAKQIALRLMLSETTVRNHIRAILLALGVHSQLEAVAYANAAVLTDHDPAA